MQFHHHGYVSTDPRVQPSAERTWTQEFPTELDVLIIGAGPAGMITAAQLSVFPQLTTRIVERRATRLVIGHADGIQARSVETFQAFGFAGRITDEAYQITQMAFWKPDPDNPQHIMRAAMTPDDPAHVSEFPHLIVNQARVLDYYAEFMANSPSRMQVDYGIEFVSMQRTDESHHPIAVRLRHSAGPLAGHEFEVRANYVVGADGAHSKVRDAIGARHVGAVSYHAWGVMDVLANTDFPDIRTKCAIQSASGGNILHIPREGGYLFRMYVDLGEVAEDDGGKVRTTPIDAIIAKANAIIHPYSLDVRHVAWYSVYEVGHRVTDRFDDVPTEQAGARDPHVFILGDACHTHSAKAGQGMNVSMQDGFNLAWKLAYVLLGRANPDILGTYTSERQVIAQNLIDFDREWSSLMARRPEEFEDPSELEDFYMRTWEFPSGFMTQYPPALLIGSGTHQERATGYPLGKRFRSAPVIRVSDGNTKQLGHLHEADGRWRIYAFADAAPAGTDSPLERFAAWLGQSPDSPLVFGTPAGADADAVFDVKVIYQQDNLTVDHNRVPAVFKPARGEYGLVNLESIFTADPAADIFEERGISRDGAVVVVRPDQYVAHVLPLDATAELSAFFRGFLSDQAQA